METERLIIRRFKADDWNDLYEYLSKEEVVKYEPYNTFDEDASKKEAARRATDESFFAVCLKENNKVIGNIYFAKDGPEDFKTYELGYVFNSTYWKKGYAAEACKRVMKYAFNELGAHRIYARCNPENSASWKLMERLHMRKEGHFKNRAFFFRDKDGNPLWHDAYEYAILEDEFKSYTE